MTPTLYARALRAHGSSASWFGVLLIVVGVVSIGSAIATGDAESLAVPCGVAVSGVFVLLYPRLFVSRAFKTNALLCGKASLEALTNPTL